MTHLEPPAVNLPPKKNPDAGRRAKPAQVEAPVARTHVGGADLTADVTKLANDVGVVRQYRYWVGVTPSCPVEYIDMAGINFPKLNEIVMPSPQRNDMKIRKPVAGSLVWLTESHIRALRDRLPRTIVRFLDDKGVADEPGTGENIGDLVRHPRRGQVITIPQPADVAAARAKGRAVNLYTPDPLRDAPAARFMFAQLCPNQDRPERGDYYPDTLEVTGLSWPDDLAESLNKLLS